MKAVGVVAPCLGGGIAWLPGYVGMAEAWQRWGDLAATAGCRNGRKAAPTGIYTQFS